MPLEVVDVLIREVDGLLNSLTARFIFENVEGISFLKPCRGYIIFKKNTVRPISVP